jgi:hypothetical protein
LSVALIAIVWLLVEFFRIRSVQRFVKAAIKRFWLKVEPYLVIIGLIVMIAGAALVGYAALRQSGDLAALKQQLAQLPITQPADAGPTRTSMLSGRLVTGLEVVQRLQQLETELDKTKQELSDTQQKLTDAQTPKTPTTRLGGLTATQIPQANSNATVDPPSFKTVKFFSPAAKSRFGDELDELETLYNDVCDTMVGRTQKFMRQWDNRKHGNDLDPSAMLQTLNDISQLSIKLHVSIFDSDTGYLQKHALDRDELKQIIGVDPNNTIRPAAFLAIAANKFADGLRVFSKIENQPDVKSGIEGLLSSSQYQDITNADNSYRMWLGASRQRIQDARRSLSASND